MSIFAGREPQAPLSFFEQISAVPRGSRNEQGIALWLKNFAETRGLWVYVDEHFNTLIKKPGQAGGEHAAPLMLQGHADIVCEKNQGTDFDFEKDGIRLKIEGDRLVADGTTLGNDDGYALAYMLALLDSADIPHPPLECLFTSMEEIGLIGAQLFDFSHITARRLIGMDGGREGLIMIGSAGGMQVEIAAPAKLEANPGSALAIRIRGLMGGHSGAEIDKFRGNANQILGRMLYALSQKLDIRVCSVSGGDKDNAIPRESDGTVAVQPGDVQAAKDIIQKVAQDVKAELAYSDTGFYVEIDETAAPQRLVKADSDRVIALHHLLPSGVEMMSMAIKGLVNASRNFASVKPGEGETLRYTLSFRSAEDSLVYELADRVCHLAQVLGLEFERSAHYPAYSYNPHSPLRDLACQVWEEMSGQRPQLQAAHGGTELGVFSINLPGLDIITVGPNSGGAHTPEEWVDLNSFGRVYGYLLEIIRRLCTQ